MHVMDWNAAHGLLRAAASAIIEAKPLLTEISPVMLAEVGVSMAEIGHSERRHALGEDDEMENRKVHAALRHGFTPLLCVGETESQKEYGVADETLRTQLKIGLYGVTPQQAQSLYIAYEPVWAIGVNGKPANKEYAEEKHAVIRTTLVERFGKEGAAIPCCTAAASTRTTPPGLSQCPTSTACSSDAAPGWRRALTPSSGRCCPWRWPKHSA